METRTYTAELEAGTRVRIYRPDYQSFHEKPDPFAGLTGTVVRVIFPGDIMYEGWGMPNGTGEVKYQIELDKEYPATKTKNFLFSGRELARL